MDKLQHMSLVWHADAF